MKIRTGEFAMIALFAAATAQAQDNPFKAPLYWSVYENQIVKEMNHEKDVHISEQEWLANIDWIDENLKEHGYTMICIDGWGDVTQINSNGYRLSHSRHWKHDYAWWSDHLLNRGMTLGMYGNPLWVHVDRHDTQTVVRGTDILVSTLKDHDEKAHFPWVQVDRPGAEEYVKGYIRFYADMGIRYFRIDFLSWYEDGWDRWLGTTGPKRPREHYLTALRWMKEAADETGMFLSLVMPHLYNEAEAEIKYGHMIRINEDALEGTWHKWSELWRGQKRVGWSVYANPADGLTYWSYIAGRNRMILDPDFIRINTFATTDEKKSVISLCLLSGAPVTISDQHNTIGNDLWLYANRELLELNRDGFVGKPLTNDPTKEDSQIWTGQMSNGDWIVGLFNREHEPRYRSIEFSSLGAESRYRVRDVWAHQDLGEMSRFSADVPPHGCIVLRLSSVETESAVPVGPAAIRVQAISTGTKDAGNGQSFGMTKVVITDSQGEPVPGANVQVTFSASFNEQVSGMTDDKGTVVLQTSERASGKIRVNVCVSHVSHPTLTYAGDQNARTCVGVTMYLGGTFNDWKLAPMKYEDGAWRLRSVKIGKGDQRLKFADTRNFTGNDWGNARGLSGKVSLTTGGDPDVVFALNRTGLYDISYDDRAMTYEITRSPVKTLQSAMFVAGTFSNWKPLPMTFKGDTWILAGTTIEAGSYDLKFLNTTNWSSEDWGNHTGLAGTAEPTTGGKPNILFTIPQTGKYDIRFNDISGVYQIRRLKEP